jgi:hypothetical protein
MLDHPPSPVMTTEYDVAFSRLTKPELCMALSLERREQGMPGACCTRGLVCECVRRKCTRAYRYSRSNPAFPAQWFDGLCRAPRRRIPLASVAAGLMAGRSGWIDVATGSLAPATGVGTTRFCRTHQRRSSCALSFTHGEIPPCEHASRRRRRVHRIPPRVRDDRDTPLLSSRDSQENIFAGLTGRPKSI